MLRILQIGFHGLDVHVTCRGANLSAGVFDPAHNRKCLTFPGESKQEIERLSSSIMWHAKSLYVTWSSSNGNQYCLQSRLELILLVSRKLTYNMWRAVVKLAILCRRPFLMIYFYDRRLGRCSRLLWTCMNRLAKTIIRCCRSAGLGSAVKDEAAARHRPCYLSELRLTTSRMTTSWAWSSQPAYFEHNKQSQTPIRKQVFLLKAHRSYLALAL